MMARTAAAPMTMPAIAPIDRLGLGVCVTVDEVDDGDEDEAVVS